MDKIKQLMVKMGLSEEVADKIMSSIDSNIADRRKQLDEEYKAKVGKAKEVCIKETEDHKRELSRRVQIFLEAKSNHIAQVLGKQAEERGTKAEAKLEKILALVEDITLDPQQNGELQAANKKLTANIKKLEEQVKDAVGKANRLQEVANSVIQRNKKLEKDLVKAQSAAVTESKSLNDLKKKGSTTTTRRPLEESVAKHSNGQTSTVDKIAATISDII